MSYVLYFIPLLVALFQYIALEAAITYARFLVDYVQPPIGLFGGVIGIRLSIPYDSIPNLVVTLHLLSLALSVMYVVYFMLIDWKKEDTVL